jgi:ribosomal protein S18 acetylase RimI-like enzyme
MTHIREIDLSDLVDVYLLGKKGFPEADVIYGSWSIAKVAEIFESSRRHCFVAVKDNLVVGFSLGNAICKFDQSAGFVEWTCVDQKLTSKGLGVRLFFKVVASFRSVGKTKIVCETMNENKQAVELFQAFGFQKTHSIQCWEFDFSSKETYQRLL